MSAQNDGTARSSAEAVSSISRGIKQDRPAVAVTDRPVNVQLQVRPLCGQRVQAALGASGQLAAQVGFAVLTGGALEAGQVGGYCQPQPVSERRQRIVGHKGQLGEGHHALILSAHVLSAKLAKADLMRLLARSSAHGRDV
jgi:hypothetical protein